MREVTNIRISTSDHGSMGIWLVDGQFFSYSMEPPWRDNAPNLSCIPPGSYRCVWHRSPKYGWVYLVTGIDGRSFVLVHPGNVGGDITKGYRTHTNGCILLGSRRGGLKIKGRMQRAVLASRTTVRRFFSLMNRESFQLNVVGDAYVGNN